MKKKSNIVIKNKGGNFQEKILNEKGLTRLELIIIVSSILILLVIAGVLISMVIKQSKNNNSKENVSVSQTTKNTDDNNNDNSIKKSDTKKNNSLDYNERNTNIEKEIITKLESSDELDRIIDVNYAPSGRYKWDKEYATSDKNGVDILDSSEEGDFRVTDWRILDVDESTGIIRLVPNSSVGNVVFNGAQGYNNAVKMLNDACEELYSDSNIGAIARSINIEDIENIMGVNNLPIEATNPTQGELIDSYDNYRYPIMYGYENKSVIDGKENIGLELSEQERLISASEEMSTYSDGAITTATNIQPYRTYYYKEYDEFKEALRNKQGVILPDGDATNYFIASRCIDSDDLFADFYVRSINSGKLDGTEFYLSNGYKSENGSAIFPIVSISSGHFEVNDSGEGYIVK